MNRAAVLAGLGALSLTGYLVAASPVPTSVAAAVPGAHVVRTSPVVYRVALPNTGAPQAVSRSGALVRIAAPVVARPRRVIPNFVPRRVLVVLTKSSILPIQFAVSRIPNSHLDVGTSEVVQAGRLGWYRVDVRLFERGGRILATRVVGRRLVVRPRNEVIAYGTHHPGPPPPPPHVQAIPSWVAALNWSALAMCESGGNPRSVGDGYYGLFQFSLDTWAGVGGIGNPIDYSPAEQTYRAELLYLRSGSSPWPTCGFHLFSH